MEIEWEVMFMIKKQKKFIVHVIDEASQYEHMEDIDDKNGFKIVKGSSQKGDEGDIVRSDAFYLVESDSPEDAIVVTANMIRVKGSDGALHSISEEFSRTRSELENSSLEDDNFVILKKDNYEYVDRMFSNYVALYCQIPHQDQGTGEEWVEHHSVHFHVTPQEKIIVVKGN